MHIYTVIYTPRKKKENMRWHWENTKMSVLENGKWKSSTAAMTTVNCISADLVMGDGSASIWNFGPWPFVLLGNWIYKISLRCLIARGVFFQGGASSKSERGFLFFNCYWNQIWETHMTKDWNIFFFNRKLIRQSTRESFHSPREIVDHSHNKHFDNNACRRSIQRLAAS